MTKPLFADIIAQHPGLAEEMKVVGDAFELGYQAGLAAAQPVHVRKPAAIVVGSAFPYPGSPAGHCLVWRGLNGANDFPVGTLLFAVPPTPGTSEITVEFNRQGETK